MNLKSLRLLLGAALFLLPTLCTSQSKGDSLITVSFNKYQFFVSYYLQAKALAKDTAYLGSSNRSYMANEKIYQQRVIDLNKIIQIGTEKEGVLSAQIGKLTEDNKKLSKRNVFLKRFTVVVCPVSFVAGGIIAYKLFH